MAALEGKWGLCLSSALNLGEFQPLWQQTYWMTVPNSCTVQSGSLCISAFCVLQAPALAFADLSLRAFALSLLIPTACSSATQRHLICKPA